MKPAAFLTLILLAACARSEDATVNAGNAAETIVEQVRSSGGGEEETAIGEWRTALQDERPAIEFGALGTPPAVTIVCGERGGLIIQRRGALAPGASPTLSVSVGGQGQQLRVVPGTGATPTQNAAIPPGDTLIAEMAQAQSPISLRFGDSAPLLLPQSPLIGQFSQTCASGGTTRLGAGAAGNTIGNAAEPANAAAPANETNAAAPR